MTPAARHLEGHERMEAERRAALPGVIVAVHGYPPTLGGGAERPGERTPTCLRTRGYREAVLCV
jgi:hypothetical protein